MMDRQSDHATQQLHSELRAAVGEPAYRTWLAPVAVSGFDDRTLVLAVPSALRRWVLERFGDVLAGSVARAFGADVAFRIEPEVGGSATRSLRAGRLPHDDPPDSPRPRGRLGQPGPASPGAPALDELRPNPNLTFERFVIGECNRLAHAAALAVAEAPGASFNPLFLCGPPGVGKTHLLHAIAALLGAHDPASIVRLTASESFTNGFLDALRANRLESFKMRFRRADVLLVDDIQFLERKTRTEEEFFHTFNALFEVGAQIVLTSDKPPADLDGLEARLRERFAGGLVAEIAPPDRCTRAAIIEKHLCDHDVVVADERALTRLVELTSLSVRALEGSLIRVAALASLTGRPITTELVDEALGAATCSHGGAPRGRAAVRPSLQGVQALVAEHFHISTDALTSSSRAPALVWPRHLAMHLARELTGASLAAIGRDFGGRDHTTVLYGCRQAAQRIARDDSARELAAQLHSNLAAPPGASPEPSAPYVMNTPPSPAHSAAPATAGQ
jgi:chromosomal replication initiator protein